MFGRCKRITCAAAAAGLVGGLLASTAALAITPFECGVSRVFGRLYISGVLEKDRSQIDMKVKRAPLLVLFPGTLSQTVVPLKISDELRDRLTALKVEPMSGRFEVSFDRRATRPEYGELLDYALPSAGELEKPATTKTELIKKGGCSK